MKIGSAEGLTVAFAIEELNAGNCKTYLLCSGTHAVLVDPVRERTESYGRVLAERGIRLDAIIETHTHADHLMLTREQSRRLGGQVIMHRDSPLPFVHRHVTDGDRIEVGKESIEVLHTPGHTPDSICLRISGAVLAGDTLLIGGSGRCDFPGGDAGKQYDAVTRKLFSLPDDTVVWPAHDYKGRTSSTIEQEKHSNPRFAGRSRADYVELMANLGLSYPDRIQEALQVNQSGFEGDEVAFPPVRAVASVPEMSATALCSRLHQPEPPLIVDVREPEEFVGELGHIQGAILVPMDALEKRLPKLAGYADRELVVVCRAGARSASAAAMLANAGFAHVANLSRGMLAWVEASLPVQR